MRSNPFWAGLQKDLEIEQVLMKSRETCGDLLRGTGFKENQRTTRLLSTHACAQVSAAMRKITIVVQLEKQLKKNRIATMMASVQNSHDYTSRCHLLSCREML